MPRLKHKKLMKIHKKEINKTLHYGKLLNQDNLHGNLNGEKEDQDGILSALPWQLKYWARN